MEKTDHSSENPGSKKWWKYFLNSHVLFFLFIIAIILFIVLRVTKWGNRVDVNNFFQNNPLIQETAEAYDSVVPKTDENGNLIANRSPHSILFFGNSVFADDRDSEDNVVNMIAEQTGATVYNCSVGKSYLAAGNVDMKADKSGLDVYNFYFMTLYLCLPKMLDYFDWLEANPNADILPETKEVRRTLETIDMNTVDTIAILYDASDYLAGHTLSNPEYSMDVTTFAGNLEAGLDMLQKTFPHIRIIVLSPTYAFGLDENGEYVSSDTVFYDKNETPLSNYMLQECVSSISQDVTFLDNIYGTFNEDEAPDCLIDNLHLNQKGREKVVARFIKALTYYDNL